MSNYPYTQADITPELDAIANSVGEAQAECTSPIPEDVLNQGRALLDEMRTGQERDQRRLKEGQAEERERQWFSFICDVCNALPEYLHEEVYASALEVISKTDTHQDLHLEIPGFAPIKFTFARRDNTWTLEIFRVAYTQLDIARYEHGVSGPIGVNFKFAQEKNRFTDLSDLPLALAIAEENGKEFTAAALQIEELNNAEEAYLAEHQQSIPDPAKTLTPEQALIVLLKDIVRQAVQEMNT